MVKHFLIGGALLALMPAMARAAPATTVPQNTEQAEITGVQQARVTPQAAVQAAEARVPGRAVAFGLEETSKVHAYEVTIATQNGLQTVQVDPSSGAVINIMPARPDALAGDGLPAKAIRSATQAPVTLTQAIQTAENQLHGRALEGGYTVRNSLMAIDVDVVQPGGPETVIVNAQNGQASQASDTAEHRQERSADQDAD